MKNRTCLGIPIIISGLLFVGCTSTRVLSDLTPKGTHMYLDPYVGAWDFIVENTPSGDESGVINIGADGGNYFAYLDSEMGEMRLEEITIRDRKLKGYFRYKGFRVNVKGVFDQNTLEGKVAVTLASFPLSATKRLPR